MAGKRSTKGAASAASEPVQEPGELTSEGEMSQEGVSETEETVSESVENAPENSEEYVGTGVPAEEAQEAPEETGGEGVDMGLKIGVDEVIVTVPKEYILRLDHNNVSTIKAGVQVMKRELADHWYSKANGVEIFKG